MSARRAERQRRGRIESAPHSSAAPPAAPPNGRSYVNPVTQPVPSIKPELGEGGAPADAPAGGAKSKEPKGSGSLAEAIPYYMAGM